MRLFYNLLPQRQRWVDKQRELAEFVIDETPPPSLDPLRAWSFHGLAVDAMPAAIP